MIEVAVALVAFAAFLFVVFIVGTGAYTVGLLFAGLFRWIRKLFHREPKEQLDQKYLPPFHVNCRSAIVKPGPSHIRIEPVVDERTAELVSVLQDPPGRGPALELRQWVEPEPTLIEIDIHSGPVQPDPFQKFVPEGEAHSTVSVGSPFIVIDDHPLDNLTSEQRERLHQYVCERIATVRVPSREEFQEVFDRIEPGFTEDSDK